jgi:hypothetical protein
VFIAGKQCRKKYILVYISIYRMSTEQLNDLIEGVVLEHSDLAPATINVNKQSTLQGDANSKKSIPVVLTPDEKSNGQTQYDVFVDDDSSKKEPFSAYEGDARYYTKVEMDFATRFYVGSLTVVGLYLFYRIMTRSR